MALVVRELSESDFKNMAGEWGDCLWRSDSDPLFMSWPWLYTWWETWSQVLGLNLKLVGVYQDEGRLVGIGPFYQRYLETPIGLRLNRLHFIGNAWRVAPTVRTEYCSLILERECEKEAREAIYRHLLAEDWDELIVCDVAAQSLSRLSSESPTTDYGLKWVTRSSSVGVRLDATGPFDDWLAALGKHTRLKAYNRRDYLGRQGKVALVQAEGNDALEEFFSNLNRFHEVRWGKPAFNQEALRFHRKLIDRLPDDIKAHCSSLMFNDKCISVLYDLQTPQGRYNLQSGYVEDFDRKVSLGTLHLGYAIEEAFDRAGCTYYDLLAGSGKSTNYKSHFSGRQVHFRTYQVTRHQLMKLVYGFRLKLPASVRQGLNRFLRL